MRAPASAPLRKRLLGILVPVAALGLLVGCSGQGDRGAGPQPTPVAPGSSAPASGGGAEGGDSGGGADADGPPTDAPVAEFCAALMSSVSDPDGGEVATFAATLARTGTPADVSPPQRQGFELYLGALQDIDEGATKEELRQRPDLGFTRPEERKVRAFFSYATAACDEGALG